MARSGMVDLIARLRVLVGDPSGTPASYSAWQATHAYVLGDYRRPTVSNSHFYRTLVAGTSGASQPTFPTNGGSVIDGTVVWQDQGVIPSGSQAFTDDDLQHFLDERRSDVVEAQLRPVPSTVASAVLYREFMAPRRWWEDSVVLSNTSGTPLTPDTEDLTAGRWTFTAGAAIPVFVTGSFFDLYGAAQAALEAWAAKVALEFDFGTDQQSFNRSDKRKGLLAVAREFARKAIPPGARPAWRTRTW